MFESYFFIFVMMLVSDVEVDLMSSFSTSVLESMFIFVASSNLIISSVIVSVVRNSISVVTLASLVVVSATVVVAKVVSGFWVVNWAVWNAQYRFDRQFEKHDDNFNFGINSETELVKYPNCALMHLLL